MFQNDIKQKFMDGKCDLTKIEYTKFFEKIAPYEESLNKGVQKFTLEEVESLLKQVKTKNSKQAKVRCSIINGLRRYINNNDGNLFKNVDKNFYLQFN